MLSSHSVTLAETISTLISSFFIVFFLNSYYAFYLLWDGQNSNEQRAKSNQQQAKTNEQRAKSNK